MSDTPEPKYPIDPNVLAMVRNTVPNQIAQDILSVQPMDEARKAWVELYRILKETGGAIVFKRVEKE
jgi:hypothetical protein